MRIIEWLGSLMFLIERYIHRKSDSLEKVAKVIQLFPECSQNNGMDPPCSNGVNCARMVSLEIIQ